MQFSLAFKPESSLMLISMGLDGAGNPLLPIPIDTRTYPCQCTYLSLLMQVPTFVDAHTYHC